MIYLHDSGRSGKLTWAAGMIQGGVANALVLSPFETPQTPTKLRPTASQAVSTLSKAHTLFEAGTHLLSVKTNKTIHYDTWKLWSGTKQLGSLKALLEHVERTLNHQAALGVRSWAPTLCLNHPADPAAPLAIAMAEAALKRDPNCIIALAGTGPFWATRSAIDWIVGELANLQPKTIALTSTVDSSAYPVPTSGFSIAGMCRTALSFSLRSTVWINNGDLAALPMVAAGASGVGTGWDLTQRLANPATLVKKKAGGRNQERLTFRNLIAVLRGAEPNLLETADPKLYKALIPGQAPVGQTAAWQAHLETVGLLVDALTSAGSTANRVAALRQKYAVAKTEFAKVQAKVTLSAGYDEWIKSFSDGLDLFAIEEGL